MDEEVVTHENWRTFRRRRYTIELLLYTVNVHRHMPRSSCFRCQKFGHGTKTCIREITCARCGDTGHDDKNCQNPVKCANCGEPHEVFSKECETWKLEKQILETSITKNISIPQAKKYLLSGPSACPGANSFAVTVGSKKSVICISTEVQTDFTWPSSSSKPIRVSQQSRASQPQSLTSQPHTMTSSSMKSTSRHRSASGDPVRPPRERSGERKASPPDQPNKNNQGGRIKLLRPPPFTQHPVRMFNKYEILDNEEAEDDNQYNSS